MLLLLLTLLPLALCAVNPTILTPSKYVPLRTSAQSTLYTIDLPQSQFDYRYAPYLIDLYGTRHQIGYDYAALLHNETFQLFNNFLNSMFSPTDQLLLSMFLDYCWDNFLAPHTPQEFLEELEGMRAYHVATGTTAGITTDLIAKRFYTVANMPADSVNIIDMLEEELEGNWPEWLKTIVNDIIALLEKIFNGCDAYGVWGSRTKGGLLYSSRNLDWNKNTGIDDFKLISIFHIAGSPANKFYSTVGFAYGLGALAGMNNQGISVSEMNLDNSRVTFNGLAFPLRLRYVLENAVDLKSALMTWDATNNTNSFNFLIGSASDALKAGGSGAYALETIMGYTSVYGANSPVEAKATFFCAPGQCKGWTNETGKVFIGKPIPEAVWRSNHAFDPTIMNTQEPLFNDTVFRYDLMHDLFVDYQDAKTQIGDTEAVTIAATLGTKGPNFLSCDPKDNRDFSGDNVMSIAYAPGVRPTSKDGYLFVAWEQGGKQWRPAACNPYVKIDLSLFNPKM